MSAPVAGRVAGLAEFGEQAGSGKRRLEESVADAAVTDISAARIHAPRILTLGLSSVRAIMVA
jgi:hypothetical protein